MPEELKQLGGDIETQFTYRPDQTDFVHALAAVKADQEAMCGYKLIMTKERSMKLADAGGAYVEVFVTFSPVPTVTAAQLDADPSLKYVEIEPTPVPVHRRPDGTVIV